MHWICIASFAAWPNTDAMHHIWDNEDLTISLTVPLVFLDSWLF
jgi:hypothetical protein